MKKIVYPKLTKSLDLSFIRFGGPGLANCMIIASRAYILAKTNNFKYINPTWRRFGPGPILRKEKDKRFYFGLLKGGGGIKGLKKCFFIFLSFFGSKKIVKIDDLGDYFFTLKNNYLLSVNFLKESINKKALKDIERINFDNVIGVHIRSGDYKKSNLFTDFSFYKNIILKIKKKFGYRYKIFVFSDGDDEELKEITTIDGVDRVFFGNALADMIALSRCKMIIASDSTFSGMASFLEQTPVIFPKRHFGDVLLDKNKEFVLSDESEELLDYFLFKILQNNL